MNVIPDDHFKKVCKPGKGPETCCFIVVDGNGIQCAKHSELAATLKTRAVTGVMVAQGDNCEGI